MDAEVRYRVELDSCCRLAVWSRTSKFFIGFEVFLPSISHPGIFCVDRVMSARVCVVGRIATKVKPVLHHSWRGFRRIPLGCRGPGYVPKLDDPLLTRVDRSRHDFGVPA
jgi:hypothetical protein